MPKFRKKPVVIEARQLEEKYNFGTVAAWVNDNGGKAFIPMDDGIDFMLIETLEGEMTALAGDWIIQGVKGEFYPCKPDIFEATYEPV